MMGLTPRQSEGLSYIRDFIVANGVAPSFQEMCEGLGYAQKNAAHRLVKLLEERGAIRCLRAENGYMKARAIEIIEPNSISSPVQEVRGTESCGGNPRKAPQPTTVAPAGTYSKSGGA